MTIAPRHGLIGLIAALALTAGTALALPGPAAERPAYHAVLAAASGGDLALARRRAAPLHNALLNKLALWLALTRGGTASFSDIAAFIAANPDWPAQTALRARAEEALAGVPDAVVRDWFARFPPVSAYGRLRQAELLIAGGRQAAGIAEIRDVWVNAQLSPFDEKSIVLRFPGVIRTADSVRRLDRLLWDGQEAAARRMMARVPADTQRLAEARLALAADLAGADGLVARVPAGLQHDAGLLYDRLRWRRRREMTAPAVAILEQAPPDLVRPAAWWTERQILARQLLADGKPALAYRLVAAHGLSDGPAFAEAEFLSGWIALRPLHDPRGAYDHFVRLYGAAKLPISLARGAYWAGRAAQAMNFPDLAAEWYRTAALQPTTYYGQLAATRLGEPPPLRAMSDPKPTAAERARFQREELVRVVELLAGTGEGDRVPPFLHRLSALADSPVNHVLIADLADSIGRQDLAVTAAKRAGYAGVTLIDHGYPVFALPRGAVERPLVLALTRQESAFGRTAISRTGARGLMQLMPATASRVAHAGRIPFSAKRLISDPHYNLQLGRAYLADLLRHFGGSYVLTIAAYNAGPTRVLEWIDKFGDPRAKSTDVVDWIESIPYGETRNYVQRVLENLQIYRLRLREHSVTLASDLAR